MCASWSSRATALGNHQTYRSKCCFDRACPPEPSRGPPPADRASSISHRSVPLLLRRASPMARGWGQAVLAVAVPRSRSAPRRGTVIHIAARERGSGMRGAPNKGPSFRNIHRSRRCFNLLALQPRMCNKHSAPVAVSYSPHFEPYPLPWSALSAATPRFREHPGARAGPGGAWRGVVGP